MTSKNWLDAATFNDDGLIPAIAQDAESGKILMMAWMNRDALELTAQTKTAVYYSRSRSKLWHKGETSGHTQKVHDIFLDCDADVVVLSVTQIGNIACHTGRQTCFYRKLDVSGDSPEWQIVSPVLKDPASIYGNSHSDTDETVVKTLADGNTLKADGNTLKTATAQVKGSSSQSNSILNQLDSVLRERKQADADSSYVASLYDKGLNKILEKVGEESIETIIAAKDLTQNPTDAVLKNDLIYEIADVWFHTMVTLAWFNIASDDVLDELARRFGLSGIEEKNNRSS